MQRSPRCPTFPKHRSKEIKEHSPLQQHANARAEEPLWIPACALFMHEGLGAGWKGSHGVWRGHDFVEVAQKDRDAIASTVHKQGKVELSSRGGCGLLQGLKNRDWIGLDKPQTASKSPRPNLKRIHQTRFRWLLSAPQASCPLFDLPN